MNSNSGEPEIETPSKRLRLNDDVNSEQPCASSSSRQTSVQQLKKQRDACRFGSDCYRRNETHLLHYRHTLLEEVFRAMMERNDFTKIPDNLDVSNGDISVLLEQAAILKDAGFQIPAASHSSKVKIAVSSEDRGRLAIPQNNTEVQKFESPGAKKDSIAELFEERKRRMLEKQLAIDKRKAEIEKTANFQEETCTSKSKMVTPWSSATMNMASKWAASCPFNIFLTKVRDIPNEKPGVFSASFPDLFDSSLGEVKSLCHINFMIETDWLFEQTKQAGLEGKPTRIIYNDGDGSKLEEAVKAFPWIKLFRVKSPFPYGHHHTKMTFAQYVDDSVRFFVYTANLIESDWDNRTQGIWISPKCPRIPKGSPASKGESVTRFRHDIMEYLTSYPVQAAAAWRDVIKYSDCSAIKTFFVASVPITSQSHLDGFQFGIKKMERILTSFEMETEPNWQLTAQCSSIGTLGASANDWLINEFGVAMAGRDRSLQGLFNLIYPTEKNVKTSFDGILGGGCLPYSAMTHMKQRWLERHLCEWKADCSGRSRAPPHIKSYSRWSPDQTKMAWFLLTSANLSKAAWGKVNKAGNRLTVMSWEAGVLFIPEVITSTKYFTVGNVNSTESPGFPLYFDVPVVKYEKKDHPWFFEHLQLAVSE